MEICIIECTFLQLVSNSIQKQSDDTFVKQNASSQGMVSFMRRAYFVAIANNEELQHKLYEFVRNLSIFVGEINPHNMEAVFFLA